MKTFISPCYSTDSQGRVRCVLTREVTRRRVVGHESRTPPTPDCPVLTAEPWWAHQTRIVARIRETAVHTALVDLSDEASRFDLARALAPKVVGYDVDELELALMGLQSYLTEARRTNYYAAADGFWKLVPGNPPVRISNFIIRWTRRTARRLEGVLRLDGNEGTLALPPPCDRSEWDFRDFLDEAVPGARILGTFEDLLCAIDSVSVS